MNPSEVALIAFATVTCFGIAGGLLVRDLVFSGKKTPQAGGPSRLRRRRDVFDAPLPKTLTEKVDQGFDRLILESGSEQSPTTVFLMMVALSLLIGGSMWLYSDQPLAGVAGAMAGLGLPLLVMAVLRARRLRAVREQLPHVVDLLARATRAGRSIEQSLSLIASEAGGVLGHEFHRCEQQLQVGRSFERAMKTFASRIPLMELQILATTLIVQRQSGGHLSDTLDRMVVVIRDRLNAQRQVRASTAAGRMSTIIVASIAPLAVFFLFAFQREHLQSLFDDPLGRSMLLGALVLEVTGLIWVTCLLRAEEQ